MNLHRIAVLLALVVAGAPCFDALGQAWPSRPLRVIVPYGPGSGPDITGRMVAAELQKRLGQPLVVENRVGAGGKIGIEAAAKAKGDPYTLFVGITDTQCILPHFYPGWDVNPVTDLIGISPYMYSNVLISANPDLPVSNIEELIRYAKAHPGIPYGSAGVGTILHLLGEQLNQRFGMQLTHVPYRNFADSFLATQRGDLKLVISGILPVQGFLKDGRLKPIVVGGKTRSPAIPNVPTFTESGITSMHDVVWFGLFTPAGVSADIVNRLNKEVVAITETPAFKSRMESMAALPIHATPAEFAATIAEESAEFGEVIRKAGIKIE
jgi:tripartite-type tricarboxylate transporter receptor subunit TctC